jgi:DNA-binding GntR family transcriptional regulator
MGFDMSFQAMAWATKVKLPTYEKFVLIMLSNYADEDGKCWPSIETLCNETGLSRPTVKRVLRKLVERKILTKVKRIKGQLQTSNLYLLAWG